MNVACTREKASISTSFAGSVSGQGRAQALFLEQGVLVDALDDHGSRIASPMPLVSGHMK